MDEKIKEYINKQKSPQKEILEKVRKIFLKTLKKPEEKMLWGVISFDNGKFYIAGLKESVNIGFAVKGLNKDEIKLFNGNGKTMRHIKITSIKEIDKKNLTKLIKMVEKKTKCSECKKDKIK